MKTLFISDLDGTLLNEFGKLSPKSTSILTDLINHGIHFTIATGRTPLSANAILKELPLSMPMILMNGALIQNPVTGQVLATEPLMQDSLKELAKSEEEFNLGGLLLYIKEDIFSVSLGTEQNIFWHNFFTRNSCGGLNSIHSAKAADLLGDQVLYGIYIDNKPDNLKAMYEKLSYSSGFHLDYYRDMYHDGTWCLELYSSLASKSHALQKLKNIIEFDHTVAFGDSFNDLTLFAACDESYAVMNAKPQVKAVANAVIGDHKKDAVAKYLKSRYMDGNT